MPETDRFPASFLWGAATSAYQVEGSPLADGAGPSNWHHFSHQPRRVLNNDTGDVACDHYRRFLDDIRLMRELGLKAYRFSISWSRVLPEGRGRLNPKGLGFYSRLVDALRAHDIQPMATLYHWDLPAALDDCGGWLNPSIAGWFADYAATLFRALDDRITHWVTLNEPWVVMDGGYVQGSLAPGHQALTQAPVVALNLLRAHALAVQAYRAEGAHEVGLVVNLEPKHPATDRATDQAAVRRADAYMNRQFLDPIFMGHFPEALAEVYGAAWPILRDAESAALKQPIDFLGINYYTRSVIADSGVVADSKVVADAPYTLPTRTRSIVQAGRTYTEMGWEVYPEGLTEVLLWVKQRYGDIPLYVTENGAAFNDLPPTAGVLDDPLRRDYLHAHLLAVHAALTQVVDLRGYFVWSLFDNFEWSYGYSRRFGLVHVDFATQVRTPKASAWFYREVIEGQGTVLFRSRGL